MKLERDERDVQVWPGFMKKERGRKRERGMATSPGWLPGVVNGEKNQTKDDCLGNDAADSGDERYQSVEFEFIPPIH